MAEDSIRRGRLSRGLPLAGLAVRQGLGRVAGKLTRDEQNWWAPIWDPARGAQPFTFTPEFAAWAMERNFDPLGEWGDVARGMGIGRESRDWLFPTRIQIGLYSVLGALRATRDWRDVHDELRKGEAPRTHLGQQHQAWKAART